MTDDTVRTFIDGLDPRRISQAIDEVHAAVRDRTFAAMATGAEVDDELLIGELLRAWLRGQADK